MITCEVSWTHQDSSVQPTLPWMLGGRQPLRLDHPQSLTSTLVNFKYAPSVQRVDGQKELACPGLQYFSKVF